MRMRMMIMCQPSLHATHDSSCMSHWTFYNNKFCIMILIVLYTSAVYARSGKSRLIWYGWHKEHWTKGAAGTGSVAQQAVERHW